MAINYDVVQNEFFYIVSGQVQSTYVNREKTSTVTRYKKEILGDKKFIFKIGWHIYTCRQPEHQVFPDKCRRSV